MLILTWPSDNKTINVGGLPNIAIPQIPTKESGFE